MEETIVILSLIVILIGVVGIGILMANLSCINSYSNFEPQWGILTGCRIMVDGKLTPVDIVRELK